MHISILTNKDIEAISVVSGVFSYKNMHSLIREYAKTNVPKGEDLEVTVSNEFLPATYTYNPSLLGQKVQCQVSDQFKSSAGSILNGEGKIKVLLFRDMKQRYERHHENPSVKQLIKEWLDLNLPSEEHLELPVQIIPRNYVARPEQLTYQIKCETGTPIKIQRLKTIWKVTRKCL
jgi:hypothetical protein